MPRKKNRLAPPSLHSKPAPMRTEPAGRSRKRFPKADPDLKTRLQERTEELYQKVTELEHIRDRLLEQSGILETFFTSTITPLVFLDRHFNFIRVNEAYAKACRRDVSEFPGKNHFELYPSDAKAIFEEVVRTKTPFQAVARPFLFPDHPDWGTTYWDWTLTPITNHQGEVEFLVFSLNNVTERKESENRIKSTNALLNLFYSKTVRKEYLESAVVLLQEWSRCRCIGIRVQDERDHIPYEAYTGYTREFWDLENGLTLQEDCICVRALTGRPAPEDRPWLTPMGSFHCEDTSRLNQGLSVEGCRRFRGTCLRQGFLSLAIIPIRYRNQALGVIHLADENKGKTSFKIVEFIETMAPLLGEAINRFKLEEDIRESENRLRLLSSQLLTVQEKERKRVAQELHDGIGQMLTAVKFKIENAFLTPGGKKEKGQALETILSMIQESIEEVRRIQMDLRPSTLDDLGILATITWFARKFQKTYPTIHIEASLGVDEREIPPALKTTVFRIMQEGFHNISKHSQADRVRFSLGKQEENLELIIEDNGKGFDQELGFSQEAPRKGFGLTSMRERAEFSGGSFSLHSAPGKGTTLRAIWPLSPPKVLGF